VLKGITDTLARVFGRPGAEEAVLTVSPPSSARPWEDRTLSIEARYDSYVAVATEHVKAMQVAAQREDLTTSEKAAMMADADNRFWIAELRLLRSETAERFCNRIDSASLRELLGRNFLGPEEWKRGFGVDVGQAPPMPASVTQELLNSGCPLHPGQKIKDTHVLMLVPKTVNGEAYTPLKLDELCTKRKGSGDKLIYDGGDWARAWKSQHWATIPQAASEWVLIPKSDPDRDKVPGDKHFLGKDIRAQQVVHGKHYPEYREVKALEVMTLALLNDLVNGEPRVPNDSVVLRCKEPNASGERVCVGYFDALGLWVSVDNGDFDRGRIGRALVRKL